jgi:hypothetical protein
LKRPPPAAEAQGAAAKRPRTGVWRWWLRGLCARARFVVCRVCVCVCVYVCVCVCVYIFALVCMFVRACARGRARLFMPMYVCL